MSSTSTTPEFSTPFVLDGVPIRNVMAPMVAQSDAAFRWLGRKHGCDLCFTQMMHARNLVVDSSFRKHFVDVYSQGTIVSNLVKSQELCLGDLPYTPIAWNEGGPLVVQLAGHDPETMVKAAQLIMQDVDDDDAVTGFDINMGCSQGIARKGRYGAFLMEESTDLVCNILSALRKSLPSSIKVSAKIRIPPNPNELDERIVRLLDCGIDFLTVHGRTLHENKTKTGPCRTVQIKQAVEAAQRHTPGFPVIANGGIETYNDVLQLQQATGAAAVMSSESLLENPTLFDSCTLPEQPRDLLQHQLSVAHDYLDLCEKYPPLPGSMGYESGSFNVVRAHLFKMLHRYVQCEPTFRDFLSDRKTTTLGQARRLLLDIDAKYNNLSDTELSQHTSFQPNASWYRRHWNASSRVKRRGDDYIKAETKTVSIQERKRQAQERIAKLRQDRLDREQQRQQQQQVAV